MRSETSFALAETGVLVPLIGSPLYKYSCRSPHFPIMSSWFEYPVTRPFTLRHFNSALLCIGVLWSALITLLNVAAVGYETVSIVSSSFDGTPLWYERFPLTRFWLPQSRSCQPAKIQKNQGDVLSHRQV
jgi:hypothetical protein